MDNAEHSRWSGCCDMCATHIANLLYDVQELKRRLEGVEKYNHQHDEKINRAAHRHDYRFFQDDRVDTVNVVCGTCGDTFSAPYPPPDEREKRIKDQAKIEMQFRMRDILNKIIEELPNESPKAT